MKKMCLLFALLFSIGGLQAQIFKPVEWAGEVEKLSETEYNLVYKATIEDHWHLYSQHLPEGGALPTEFEYNEEVVSKKFELVGKAVESKTITKYDKVFEMDLTFFDHEATLVQRIKLLDPSLNKIDGSVIYQTCDDERCLFETEKLNFDLSKAKEVKEGEDLHTKFFSDKKENNTISLAGSDSTSQIFEPVKWSTKIKKVDEDIYRIYFLGQIDEGWHVYSSELKGQEPIPTTIKFNNINGEFELIDPLKESKGKVAFDKVFEKEVKYFEKKANFRQKIKLNKGSVVSFNVELEYAACDDTKCIPPTKELFYFKYENDSLTQVEKDDVNSIDNTVDSKEDKKESKGLFTIFFIAFLSGFAALLTPCVFPMIPMTVSFFTKQSKTKAAGIRNAIIYGVSIIVIYVFLGAIVTWVFGADALNALSTNVWFNIIFFVLLVVFAFSFMGAFEIMLPNSWANKVDRQADRGGFIGIFFMALALAIVSFSCTGPIVGTLLVEAASKGGIAPFVGMFGFSLALALPFTLFAMFPGWLNSLPRSGGWLNSVKVVLGFLELALAFKFLSNADLVVQGHWLEREVFLAIWIAVFGTLTLYLFGKIQLPHDSPIKHLSVGRTMFGVLVLTFTIYLIPGLWGAPLKLISGFPPPMSYSESPYGVGFMKSGGGNSNSHTELPDGAHHGPHDIISFHDYETGLAYAKKVGKPVLIDFTGYACVNCRKMEEKVWAEKQIFDQLNNDIVLISLHVDDKAELPKEEQYVSEHTGKEIETIGNKWSEFQMVKYKANAQPYYVLIDHDENNLIDPVGYTPDVQEYNKWLSDGISKFKKK